MQQGRQSRAKVARQDSVRLGSCGRIAILSLPYPEDRRKEAQKAREGAEKPEKETKETISGKID